MTINPRHRPRSHLLLCALLLCTVAIAADKGKNAPATKKADNDHTVHMKDKKYVPDTLTIKAGESVTWQNDDDHDHTVIADDKSFKSGNINPDDTFAYTFKKTGTFKYACKYHPRMKGTVTVEK